MLNKKNLITHRTVPCATDIFIATGQGFIGNNMYVYCGNNPVNRADPSGQFWKEIGDFFINAWNGIKNWASNTFGAGATTTSTIHNVETPIIPDPIPITITTGVETTLTVTEHGDSTKTVSVYADGDLDDPITSTAGMRVNIKDCSLDFSLGYDNIGVYASVASGNTTNSFGVRLNISNFKLGFERTTAISWDRTTITEYTNASISGFWIAFAYVYLTTGQQLYPKSPALAH